MSNFFVNRYCSFGFKEENFDPAKIKKKRFFRLNTNVCGEKVLDSLKGKKIKFKKSPLGKYCYEFESEFNITSSLEYLEGEIYLQSMPSQVAAEALAPGEKELVLDMAAAPGSKTTLLSQLMNNRGRIIALEIESARIKALANNLERLNCRNVIVYKKDARFVEDFGLEFDKILLDAPCSGNFFIEPGWFGKRRIEDIKENSEIQKTLVESACSSLKKGGILVYSTCSLEPEENEEVVEFALSLGMEVENLHGKFKGVDGGLTEKTKGCLRFWPHKWGTTGFFIARLRKT